MHNFQQKGRQMKKCFQNQWESNRKCKVLQIPRNSDLKKKLFPAEDIKGPECKSKSGPYQPQNKFKPDENAHPITIENIRHSGCTNFALWS